MLAYPPRNRETRREQNVKDKGEAKAEPLVGEELVIRHAGRQAKVDLSTAEFSEVSFAAFYADCEHEVQPITEGHRVCLVYNLIQDRSAKAKDQSLEAPDYRK